MCLEKAADKSRLDSVSHQFVTLKFTRMAHAKKHGDDRVFSLRPSLLIPVVRTSRASESSYTQE
jgi:hypothetical protein